MTGRAAGRAGMAALVALTAAVVAPMLVARPGPALAAAAPAIVVTPTPCSARAGACTAEPASLGVTFPTGIPAGVDAVDVAWKTTGRPSGAPAPATTDAVLTTASGSCTTVAGQAATVCSWPWPTGLEVAGSPVVLNGVYQVTPCATGATSASNTTGSPTSTSSGPAAGSGSAVTTGATSAATTGATSAATCTPASSPPAAAIGVSVAPLAPGSLSVRAASSAAGAPVTVSWALGAAPDLAGYVLSRNGTALDTCTVHGAVSAGATACGAPPSFTDRAPGSGTVGYQVVAYRYGVTGGFSDAVASPPTAAKVTLQAAGSDTPLNPGPALGVPAAPVITVPTAPIRAVPTSPHPAATTPTTADTYGQLPFNASPSTARASAAPLEDGPTTSPSGVGGIALVAAGLLVGALAGHLLYLRAAAARYQAAHAAGAGGPAARARGPGGGDPPGQGSAPRPGPGPPARPRRRVQWGSWPPLAPAERRHR